METTSDCPFLPAAQLGLAEKERDALIKTLLLMEAGKMVHVRSSVQEKARDGEYPFRMATWREQRDCGTVCCIGGTAELIEGLPEASLAGKAHYMALTGSVQLYNLFYRWGGGSPPPAKAAKVLRGYLTTGKTRW
jgi:hypothetical protein